MADTGTQSDNTTQSFVVRTWRESPGDWRGTVRHVQSQAQHGFTRFSQLQEFIEQNLTQSGYVPAPANRGVPRLSRVGLPRRRFLMVASAVVIVLVAGVVVIASVNLPARALFGSAVGQASPGEVLVALLVGLVLGSVGTAIWLRRYK